MPATKLIAISLSLIFSSLTFGKALEVRVLAEKEESFELKSVCEHAGVKDALLIDIKDSHRIDCMGRTVAVADFCSQKFKKPKENSKIALTKSYVGLATKRVYCQLGESVLVRLNCNEGHSALCKSAGNGCEKLKASFASGLPLQDSRKIGEVLRCYYSANDLDELKTDSATL